jgi:type I restriction enzyme M protein
VAVLHYNAVIWILGSWESTQLEQLGEIEKRLWSSADTLRANSNFASNEYFLPVMGLIFLRHAYSRFLKVKDEIEASLPTRGASVVS